MAWKWYDSKVIKIANESPNTKRFWLQVPDTEVLDFRAGQFVTMDLPISDKRLKRWRSYSIANAPNGNKELELCIVKLDGGAASDYLFNDVQIGTEIKFKGPDGTFTLKEPIEKDLVFICTGTGVAPFRSMIWDIHKHNKSHQKIHLIFGTRTAENILYRTEFEQLQQEIPDFKYTVALSREENLNPADFPFETYKGYVHEAYLQHYAIARADVAFYICGWSNMIDDAVANLLLQLKYDKSQIHYELYG